MHVLLIGPLISLGFHKMGWRAGRGVGGRRREELKSACNF